MWRPEAVVQTLAARGELWEAAPGLVGMRGEVLALYRALEQALARLSATETADDWQVPPGIDLATLARAGYFASFPQWLTAVAHLSEDSDVLEWIATDPDPAAAARRALPHLRAARGSHHLAPGARNGAGYLLAARGYAAQRARAELGVHDARDRLPGRAEPRRGVPAAGDARRRRAGGRARAGLPDGAGERPVLRAHGAGQ